MMVFYCGGYCIGINNIIFQIWFGVNFGYNNVWVWMYQSIYVKIDVIGWGFYLYSNIIIFKGKCVQGGFQCQRI